MEYHEERVWSSIDLRFGFRNKFNNKLILHFEISLMINLLFILRTLISYKQPAIHRKYD